MEQLTKLKLEQLNKQPVIESFVSVSENKKWMIHKTVIIDIKPTIYLKKALEGNIYGFTKTKLLNFLRKNGGVVFSTIEIANYIGLTYGKLRKSLRELYGKGVIKKIKSSGITPNKRYLI